MKNETRNGTGTKISDTMATENKVPSDERASGGNLNLWVVGGEIENSSR
jgi:hypothetical protein